VPDILNKAEVRCFISLPQRVRASPNQSIYRYKIRALKEGFVGYLQVVWRRVKVFRAWKIIESYPITQYKCGLVAGQQLRLLKDLVIRDRRGRATGKVIRAGEIWLVIPGSDEPPLDVWLRGPDGERHTWDDLPSIFDHFELVG
jgi:hypothetical protein